MEFVIDANVLFAALIKDSITLELLFYDGAHFFAPEYVLQEFYEHRTEILKKTKRTPEDFDYLLEYLERRITIIPQDDYAGLMEAAKSFSPDADDVPYLALALKLNVPIWSNDAALKEKQNRVKVYTTKDIITR
jgi:predicted nucleic acid-binding protein